MTGPSTGAAAAPAAPAGLAARILAGDRLALSRVITRVENRRPEAAALLR